MVGDLLEDIVVRTATPPAAGTDTPAKIERRRGGSAANVAAAAASIGAPVRLICRVGLDPLGDRLVDDLVACGVDVRAQRAGRSGSVVVLVDGSGERTMLPDRATATGLRDVDPAWLDEITWLHVPAYSLLAQPIGEASLGMIGRVRMNGASVSVDVSSVGIIEAFGVDDFVALLDVVRPDVLFANQPESALVPLDRPWVTVVKNGADPVLVKVPGDASVERIAVPKLPRVRDTTGAGDAFAAGYIVAAMARASVGDAVRAGIRLAGVALIERTGSSMG